MLQALQQSATPTLAEATLRDWFASEAMGRIAMNAFQRPDQIAQQAYELADAMLAERTRRPAAA